MLDIIIALLILNIMIIAHEFGHYLAAKSSGVDVDEFAVGFGPTLLQKRWNGTNWAIKLFPLGGYNALKGEQGETAGPGSFVDAAKRSKLKVLFAGSFMNFFVAIIAFYFALGFVGWNTPIPMDFNPIGGEVVPLGPPHPYVDSYVKDSPAAKLGLELPYYIEEVNGQIMSTAEDVVVAITQNENKEVDLLILTADNQEKLVTLIKGEDNKVGIGVYDPPLQLTYAGSFWTKSFSGISHTINMIVLTPKVIGTVIKNTFATHDAEQLGYVFSGPVAVVAVVGAVVENSNAVLADLANMTGLIGISLGIFNLLPFPGLDGWHIVLVLYEKIRGKKPNQELVAKITAVGLLLLFGTGILVIVKDIYLFFIK